jgi:ADP-ribose pyrophosphatase YjhB (NUDIX family)
MSEQPPPRTLLEISRELKSIAEAGLRYSDGPYDLQRYRRLHQLASEILHADNPQFRWPREFGYATPKVDVRGALIEDGRILLVKESSNGLWTLPGGWADLNLSPAENIAKEMEEETGLEVEVGRLFACLDRDKHGHPPQAEHVYKLYFLCTRLAGELTTSLEISEVAFFLPDELPPLCPYRIQPEQIALAIRHAADPSLPVVAD